MEENGLKLKERELKFAGKAERFDLLAENEERTEFNDALREMSILLREAAQDGDVMHAIRLERQCIALDQTRRPDRIDELNRQLLKSSAAEQGVRFVMDAPAYRAQLEKVFIHGIPELSSGEPYERFVSDQKRYLEASKKNFRTQEEVGFFNARISNLNAGIGNFKELQEKAVFPERAAAKLEARKLVGDEGQVFRPRAKGERCYKGEILAVTKTHAVQRFSARAVCVHALEDFPDGAKPTVGEVLLIRYADARIKSVEPVPQRNRIKAPKDLER